MRKLTTVLAFAVLAIGLVAGCSSVEDKPAIRLTDDQGIVEPREVTVGYVN